MARGNKQSIENKIRRLTREIHNIEASFYGAFEGSTQRDLYAGMLERKRDDVVRAIVLQMHTAIEDVLTSWITCEILGTTAQQARRARSKSARALHTMLWGSRSIGFDMKLNLAVALGLIAGPTQRKLAKLNELRNKCSHNWLLKMPVRRGKRPRQKKPPLLLYKGRDLHRGEVLDDFMREYGPLYARLWVKYLESS